MRLALLLLIAIFCFGGSVGLPTERMVFPSTTGTNLVCAWNNTTDSWVRNHYILETNNVVEFNVPSWGDWYWVGVWEVETGSYVYGKWIGHFLLDAPETNEAMVAMSVIPDPTDPPTNTNPPPPIVILTEPYPPRKIRDGAISEIRLNSIAWDMEYMTREPRLFNVYHSDDLVMNEWILIASNCFYEYFHNNPSGFYKVAPK